MFTGLKKGQTINLDKDPSAHQGLRYALNAINKRDLLALSNEGGSKLQALLKSGYEILGQIYVNQNYKVVFLADGINSEIGRIRNKQYETVFDNSELNFKLGSYVSGTFKYNEQGEVVIYFTDYVNDIRYLNLDNVPGIGDIRQLRISRYISKMSSVSVDRVNSSGGQLNLGQYFFFYSYVDATGVETPILNGTKGVQIGKESIEDNPYFRYRGGSSDETTNKSIDISISNLDTSYSTVRVYVLKHYDGTISSVERLADVDIRGTSIQYTYTGTESTIDSSLDKINEVIAYYSTAKSIAQVDNALYIANLKARPEDPKVFQPIANNIIVTRTEREVTRYGTDYNFKAPLTNYQRSHFMNDEVYAFYISFIWDDGNETPAYHIPGRAAQEVLVGVNENSPLSVLKTKSPYSDPGPSADIDEYLANFPNAKVYNYYGFKDNGTQMGYWENANEVYPNIPEVWGDLAGQPVRHHRFPEAERFSWFKSDENYYVNGVILTNVVIPEELKENLIGWKLYYAKRTEGNKRILDQSYLSQSERCRNLTTGRYSAFLYGTSATRGVDPIGSIVRGKILASNPFTMIRNQTDPNLVSYIRPVASLNPSGGSEINGAGSMTVLYSKLYDSLLYSRYTWKTASSLGEDLTWFPTVAKLGETGLKQDEDKWFEINDASVYSQSILGTDLAGDETIGYGYKFGLASAPTTSELHWIVNFHTGFENLYQSFDQQTLVYTGYTHTNLDITTSDVNGIYGGDCSIGPYAHLTVGRFESDLGTIPAAYNIYVERNLHLFAIEQQENIGLRNEGPELGEAPNDKFLTSFTATEILKTAQENYDSTLSLDFVESWIFKDKITKEYVELNNSYTFNSEFSSTAPQSARNKLTTTQLNTRIARSGTHTPNNLIDQFRNFASLNYIDLPLNRGPIEVIKSYNNLLLIHLERALAITKGKEQLQIDTTNVYLGTSDILQQPPEEIIMTEEGHAGNQNIEGSLVTPFGYFFVDREAKIMYQFNGRLNQISEFSISNWFYDNASFYVDDLAYTPVLDPEDKQLFSYRLGYDARYKRILITKHDVTPTELLLSQLNNSQLSNIIFKEDGYYYTTEPSLGESPSTETKIQYSDTRYFTRKSFTISYDPILEGFISFHSYSPDLYLTDRKNLQTVFNNRLWDMNDLTNPGLFYGTRYNFEVDLVTNFNPSILANGVNYRLSNIIFNTTSVTQNLVPQYRDTFDEIYVYNENQTSGLVPLTSIRHLRGEWSINELRDISTGLNIFEDRYKLNLNQNNLNSSLPWYKKNKFYDTYIGYKLVYNNASNNLLTLHASSAVPVKTRR